MFSFLGRSPSLLYPHRRGGPVHVEVILRDMEIALVEACLTTGEHGHEQEPDEARPPSHTPYPQAA